MLIDHWPLLGLRLITSRLELRLPSGEELGELADLAAEGMHDPGSTPFLVSWPGLPPRDRARALMQRHWRHRGDWSEDDWSLDLAVFADGQVVGQQEISARDYGILREVSTFSWLGVRHHGRGIGTEMRAAVLHLAFAGLGATDAVSGLSTTTLHRCGSRRNSATGLTASSGSPRAAGSPRHAGCG